MVGGKYEAERDRQAWREAGDGGRDSATVPKITVLIGGSFRRGQLWHVRARLFAALPLYLA